MSIVVVLENPRKNFLLPLDAPVTIPSFPSNGLAIMKCELPGSWKSDKVRFPRTFRGLSEDFSNYGIGILEHISESSRIPGTGWTY
jgi:hypothetical protein